MDTWIKNSKIIYVYELVLFIYNPDSKTVMALST